MELIYAAIALAVGLTIGFLLAGARSSTEKSRIATQLSEAEKQLLLEKARSDQDKILLEERKSASDSEIKKLREELSAKQNQNTDIEKQLSVAITENKNLSDKLNIQKEELIALQEKLTTEFENIANRILKLNSQEFSETNQKRIGEILIPLRERIDKFEKKVDEAYDKEFRDKVSLKEEVRRLAELNTRVIDEAGSLTRALRGDSKKQGDWGEVVLERVLERSGLVKGEEYFSQYSEKNEEGSNIRPDVIIQLPDKKHIIIDAKVSLTAYDACVNTDDAAEKAHFQKQHVESVKNHIKLLNGKNYPAAPGLNSPDFVLMFMPIESSFSLAVQAEVDLFNFAWERRIVIVSPSTLLATLRTIAGIWRQEKQNKNALEIARLAGSLFDKFEGFLKDLQAIHDNMDKAQESYHEAYKKLSTGKGNVISVMNKLKSLGAKTNKEINNLFEESEEEDNTPELLPDNI
ncbi:MAG: DNA recombination protein RmuC [Bacteroidota bacterium]